MLEELTGEFYNQTLYKAENNLKIPKKKTWILINMVGIQVKIKHIV